MPIKNVFSIIYFFVYPILFKAIFKNEIIIQFIIVKYFELFISVHIQYFLTDFLKIK